MTTRKIITAYDVRRAKYDAEPCTTRKAADRFVADSLNTQGWTIQSARV